MLTLKEISTRLEIPESTARYYRDTFSDYIPCHGEGRSRRYPDEAVEIFGFISQCAKSNIPFDQVREELAHRYGINATTAEPQQLTTTTQQPSQEVLAGLAVYLRQTIEQAVERETAGLRQEILELRTDTQAQARRQEERDRKLMELVRQKQEHKISWWRRILK